MLVYIFVTALFAILWFAYKLITKNHDYWNKKNVPHLKPWFIFGNYIECIFFKKYGPEVTQEICRQFPDEPYVGTYYGTDPALIIKDPDLIKLVMSKDFYYFNYRELAEYTHKELITQNMFFNGGQTWKILRQNLTSLFSSAKMKNMFYLIENCALNLDDALNRELSKEKTIEIRSLLAKYTMDCIGNCAFGVSTGTLQESKDSHQNPFTIIGEKLFDVTNYGAIRLILRTMWPNVFYKLGFRLFERNIDFFFNDLLTKVFKNRQYTESSRNDFVDMLLTWKLKRYLTGDKISNLKTGEKETVSIEVSDNLLIGQCVMFFAAGFETTSTTTSMLLYELAKNKNAQDRVIEEIDDYYQRHSGKIEYECVNEMPFLQACLDETLRLYPVLGIITRESIEDYTFPTGLTIEKGCRIHIPVYYLHYNEDYFPNPEEFKPERFLGEEKKNQKQFIYMPFGEGPRICIGLRFARMPILAGLLTILKNYSIELADRMPRKMSFQPRAMVTQPMSGVHVKFIPRKSTF